MAENMTPTFEQIRQLNRSLMEKVLDKAASDPQWKQQLLDDSEAAMRTAGFTEIQQLQQMQARQRAPQGDEVRGQQDYDIDIEIEGGGSGGFGGGFGGFGGFGRVWQCYYFTVFWG